MMHQSVEPTAMERLKAQLAELPSVSVRFGGGPDALEIAPASLIRDKVLAVVQAYIDAERAAA